MNRLARAALGALLAATLLGACGDGPSASAEATAAEDIEQLPVELLPSEILGLTVQREDMSAALQTAQLSYVNEVGLYSLRRDELLQATIQISRFNANAAAESADFRRTLLSQVGGSVPKQVVIGGKTVYLTTGTKQTIAVFFQGRTMIVVAIREDYDQPRTLLRQALELEVEA
ncbi:MAG: hypothetical protein M3Q68_04105 [Actinomycetota bacterium]|nr:hypothetical protein [Actinomycetota bacterium]